MMHTNGMSSYSNVQPSEGYSSYYSVRLHVTLAVSEEQALILHNEYQ